jgi:hypothetical protein
MSSEAETSLDGSEEVRDLIRSLPLHSAFGLPVYVATPHVAPILDCVALRFTSLGIIDGNCTKICSAFEYVYFVVGKRAAFRALKPPAMERTFL